MPKRHLTNFPIKILAIQRLFHSTSVRKAVGRWFRCFQNREQMRDYDSRIKLFQPVRKESFASLFQSGTLTSRGHAVMSCKKGVQLFTPIGQFDLEQACEFFIRQHGIRRAARWSGVFAGRDRHNAASYNRAPIGNVVANSNARPAARRSAQPAQDAVGLVPESRWQIRTRLSHLQQSYDRCR